MAPRTNILRPSSFLFTILIALSFSTEANARLLVSVTVPAQAWLVKQISGNSVEILTMIPEGNVPESALPGPRKLARMRQANMQIIVGHPALFFEERYIIPLRKFDSTTVLINMFELAKELQPLRKLEGTDPHLWTSPAIMLVTANAIASRLAQLDPENTNIYQQGLQRLVARVKNIDEKIRENVQRSEFRQILVFHPAWGHFSQDYGLSQLAVEAEGKTPDPRSLVNILRKSGKQNINFIISSPGTDQRQAGIIAAQLNIDMLVIDPMSANWINMIGNLNAAIEKLGQK